MCFYMALQRGTLTAKSSEIFLGPKVNDGESYGLTKAQELHVMCVVGTQANHNDEGTPGTATRMKEYISAHVS